MPLQSHNHVINGQSYDIMLFGTSLCQFSGSHFINRCLWTGGSFPNKSLNIGAASKLLASTQHWLLKNLPRDKLGPVVAGRCDYQLSFAPTCTLSALGVHDVNSHMNWLHNYNALLDLAKACSSPDCSAEAEALQ